MYSNVPLIFLQCTLIVPPKATTVPVSGTARYIVKGTWSRWISHHHITKNQVISNHKILFIEFVGGLIILKSEKDVLCRIFSSGGLSRNVQLGDVWL